MACAEARKGRHRQLYDGHHRLVSGCIPYRLRRQVEDQASGSVGERIEVLMISTPNRTDLIFPKGGWENDESVQDAAHREAFEEAGVRGILHTEQLGVWEFRSKSRQDMRILEGGCRGHMFALKVTEELETWPEQESHNRRWLNIEEAFRLCRYDWMRKALNAFNLMVKENDINLIAAKQVVDSNSASVTAPRSTRLPNQITGKLYKLVKHRAHGMSPLVSSDFLVFPARYLI